MKLKKVAIIILLACICIKIVTYIIANSERYTKPFNPVYFSKLYADSQYVKGTLSKGGIGDDGLYAYAGYYYVFQNGDVSNVNFEHPPLGKYLIGISIFLFNNENAINIIYFVLILLCTYKIGKIVLKDSLSALLSVGLVSIDPYYLDHLLRSLLDLPFTLFFLASIYFFIKSFKSKNFLYVSFVFLALLFTTKFFPAIIFIYAFLFGVTFIYKRNHIRTFIFATPIIPAVYLLLHTSYFIYHPSIIEFFRHKKWMIAWWTGSPIKVGNIIRNAFTGYYEDSTGKTARENLWTPFIPLVAVLGVTSFRRSIIAPQNLPTLVLYGLCIIYILYLVFFGGGVLKFIMPIYPLLSILAIQNCWSFFTKITKVNKTKIAKK